MWWKKNGTKQRRRSLSWSTFNGSSTEASESLDQSKHRCNSVKSLLSLEQCLVTCDDERNIRLTPLVYQQRDADIPFEVELEEEQVGLDVDDDLYDVTADVALREPEEKSLPALPVALLGDSFAPLFRDEEVNQEDLPLGLAQMKSKKDISSSTPATLSSTLCETNENADRAVQFGTVEVHYHKQEIGSTVPVRGPPVGLSWTRLSFETFESVDDFLCETHPNGKPRPYRMLQEPSTQRTDRLLDLGYTLREIRESTREAGVVRTKRLQSSRYSSRNKNWLHLLRNSRNAGRDPLRSSTKESKTSILVPVVPTKFHA